MKVAFVTAELGRWDQVLRDAGPRPRVLGLPFFADERPLRGAAGLCDWRLGGRLSRLLGAGDAPARVSGALGEQVLLPTGPRLPWERLVLFGLGPQARFGEVEARDAARQLLTTLSSLAPSESEDGAPVTLALVPPGRSTGALSARQALELLLDEAVEILDERVHALAIVESTAGQKEAAELARRFAGTSELGSPSGV